MKPYGIRRIEHGDDDVDGIKKNGRSSKAGVRQSPAAKATVRRARKRRERQGAKKETS